MHYSYMTIFFFQKWMIQIPTIINIKLVQNSSQVNLGKKENKRQLYFPNRVKIAT